MNELKITFYLKRNEVRADGYTPILGRIRIGRSMAQFSAKVCVPEKLWDVNSGRAVGKGKTARSVNAELDKLCVSIHAAYKSLSERKNTVAAADVKNAFQGISSCQETLVGYYEANNEQFLKNVGVNRSMDTYKGYCRSLRHLKDFMYAEYRVHDMPFSAVTPSFVTAFDSYLRVELKMGNSTITNIMSRLHRVLKVAINNGLMRQDPFCSYEYRYEKIVPKFLTEKEIGLVMNTPLPKPNMNLVRDVFLFSVFTGVAFTDMRNLTENNLSVSEDGTWWIHSARQKTGTPFHVPMLPLPKELIEKYRGIAVGGRLFPMLSCSKTNINLKKIAVLCGIKRRITFHMARHSYASVVTLSQGVPLDTVRELMGHRDWKATRIYAHVTHGKISEDMDELEKRIKGKFILAGEKANRRISNSNKQGR